LKIQEFLSTTAEPEEAAPARRLMPRFVPRFVPRLPRIIPVLSRHQLLQPRLAPSRHTSSWVRRVHARAKLEIAAPDFAKTAVARKPVRHVFRPVQHHAQRAYAAPNTVSSYPTRSASWGAHYR
jgi:hypothetical protein